MGTMAGVTSPVECSRKRKPDSVLPDPCDNSNAKKSKKELKRNKTTREQERILLENFVKYGILPSPSDFGEKSIPVQIPSPISPLRTPARPCTSPIKYEDQRVPEADIARVQLNPKQAQRNIRFWRPWVTKSTTEQTCKRYSAERRASVSRKNALQAQKTNRKSSNIQAHQQVTANVPQERLVHHASPKGIASVNAGYNFRVPPLASGTFHAAESRGYGHSFTAQSESKMTFNPTVKTWDTSSPEFLNTFKQPVKLMWPRSKAYDYKYKDAQELLQAFPVQAAIGFYDDSEDAEQNHRMVASKHNYATYQRHLVASNLSVPCTPVLN